MHRRKLLLDFFKIFDLLCITFGIYLSIWITQNDFDNFGLFLPANTLSISVPIGDLLILLFCLLLWHITLNYFRLYTSRRLSTFLHELSDIVKATSFGSIAIVVFLAITSEQEVNIYLLLILWSVTTNITVLSRIILRMVMKQIRLHGRNLRMMLIIGANDQAVKFSEKITNHHELGYQFLGFAEDNNSMPAELSDEITTQIVTSFDELPEFLNNNTVDEVAIFYPLRSHYDAIRKVIHLCEDHGIVIRLTTNIFELKLGESYVDFILDEPLVTIFTGNMQGWKMYVKRVLDVSISLILLVLLLPLFGVVAVLIIKDSPGPVFFLQERIGIFKKRFKIIKFRTMVEDAEHKIGNLEEMNEAQGPVFKIKDDPRITKLGKFLRKSSIDELPQLINVLKGDMSLVGPRPLPVRDYQLFNLDWHRRRFSVRPGITCLWQIGGRSDLDFDEWMELDMKYIDSWSLFLDFKILFRTIPSVLKGAGAV